jgi:hypothetical protein
MKHSKQRKEFNIHHIIGKKHKDNFNVEIPENKIIVEITKHEALNCLVGDKQSPQEQLSVLYNERWINILSEKTKKRIEALLSMSDEEFYIDKIIK